MAGSSPLLLERVYLGGQSVVRGEDVDAIAAACRVEDDEGDGGNAGDEGTLSPAVSDMSRLGSLLFAHQGCHTESKLLA